MSSYSSLVRKVATSLRRNDVSKAISVCEKVLTESPEGPFHVAIGKSWTDLVEPLSLWITDLYGGAQEEISVKALYCEMNRFDINCDRWYLDGFGYEYFGGSTRTDWLPDWMYCSGPERQFNLVGMESLQDVFDQWDRGTLEVFEESTADAATVLVTLRMIELVNNASTIAYSRGGIPQNIPVLAAAHEAEPVFTVFGATKPKASRTKVARPEIDLSTVGDGWDRIYVIESGHDARGNPYPWCSLTFTEWWKAKTDDEIDRSDRESSERDRAVGDQVVKAAALASEWIAPEMFCSGRGWACDFFAAVSLRTYCPAVNEKAMTALVPLFGDDVEFLPVKTDDQFDRWIIHSLVHIPLSGEAEHNGRDGKNITSIKEYAFDPDDLRGIHLFRIRLPEYTPAGKAGGGSRQLFVSEQFKQTYGAAGLQGIVFKEVFRYPNEW